MISRNCEQLFSRKFDSEGETCYCFFREIITVAFEGVANYE